LLHDLLSVVLAIGEADHHVEKTRTRLLVQVAEAGHVSFA